MLVRRATADDADAWAAVMAAVAAEDRWIATEPPVDVARQADRMRAFLDNGDVLFVLVDEDDTVIGMLGLHGTVTGVVALGMSVVAGSRGRGGGRALMDAAIAHLAGSDLHKVELEVWPDNGRAIALYMAYGFEVEGVRRSHHRRRDGTLRSSMIMARLL